MALRIGTGVIDITPDLGNFGQLVSKDVTNAFDRIGRQAQNLGTAFLPLSLAMGGILAASANLAVQFEDDFVKIEALVGETQAALDKMIPTVLNLSRETGRTATELSDALYFVESSGIRGQQALDVLDSAARAAAVGLGDAAQVADTLTSAVNAYALSGLTAEAATDVLVATVREGKIETDALGTVIGRVIPVAAQLGVSFDQVGAAIASASKVGLSAEEATTALRQTLVTLIKPSAEARGVLEAYGLTAEGLRRQIREEGLLATLATLTATFGDNQEALNRVFQNVRALTGVLSLVGENAEQVKQVFDVLSDSTGDLNTAFEATQRSTRFQLDRAFASLSAAAISLGSTLLPVIRAVAERITDLGNAFADLPEPVRNFIGAALGVGAIAAPFLLVVGSLLRTAGALSEVRTAQLLAAQATQAHVQSSNNLNASLANQVAQAGGAAATQRRGLSGLLLGPTGSGTRSVAGALGSAAAIFFASQVIQTYVDTLKKEGEKSRNEVVDTVNDFVSSIGTGASLGAAGGGLIGAFGGPIGIVVGAISGAVGGGVAEIIKQVFFDAGQSGAGALEEGFTDYPIYDVQRTALELGVAAGISFQRGIADIAGGVGAGFDGVLEEIKARQKDFLSVFQELDTATASIFEDTFDGLKKTSFDAIAEIARANAEGTTELQEVVETLRERGLTGIAQQLAENVGPEALSAARAIKQQLLDDPDSVFNLEADVQRLGGDLRDQFIAFLGSPETGGLPIGLVDRLDEQAAAAVEDSVLRLGAELGRERPELADALALSVTGSVQQGLINGIAQAFAGVNPEDVLPTEELQTIINEVFASEDFESVVVAALAASRDGRPFTVPGDAWGQIQWFDIEDISYDIEQQLAKIIRGLPATTEGPLPPLTLEEKIALSGVELDLGSLAESVAADLTAFADTNLPELLANIDFARGDITFKEALVQGLTGQAAEITADELSQQLGLGSTFAAAIVSQIQNEGPELGRDLVQEILNQVHTARTEIDMLTPWKEIGNTWITGIIQGLDSGQISLQEAMRRLMNGTFEVAKITSEAESPSKRYARLGADLVAGLRQGIERSPLPEIPMPGIEQAAEYASRINQVVVQFNNPKHVDPVMDSERILGVLRTTELVG